MIGCRLAIAGADCDDVEHVADRRNRADDQRGDEHAAADQENSCGPRAVVPAPALSCLSRHLRTSEITVPIVISCQLGALAPQAVCRRP